MKFFVAQNDKSIAEILENPYVNRSAVNFSEGSGG
jgi:hypothetical protein